MNEGDEFVVQFYPNGIRCAVYSDELAAEFGTPHIARASNIVWNDTKKKWEVFMDGKPEPLFAHQSRSECVRWEVAYIHADMTRIMQHHFPSLTVCLPQ